MKPIVPLLVLFLSLPAVAQTLFINAPSPISDEAERTGSFKKQLRPIVAWNGGSGLVVWQGTFGFEKHVYAARIDAAGRPLDSAPFIVFTGSDTFHLGAVPLGSGFLVVSQSDGIAGALVSRDGAVRQLGKLDDGYFFLRDVASSGSMALVVGTGDRPDYANVLLWIDTEGRVVSSDRHTFAQLTIRSKADFDGSVFLLAWQQVECAVFTCTTSFHLSPVAPGSDVSRTEAFREEREIQSFTYTLLELSTTPDRALVVVEESRSSVHTMQGMFVDHRSNTVAAQFAIERSDGSGSFYGELAPVANDGQSFVIAYPFVGYLLPAVFSTRMRRIESSGATSAPQVLQDDLSEVTVAWTGSGFLVARNAAASPATGDVRSIVVTPLMRDGSLNSSMPQSIVSRAPNYQDAPGAAWDGQTLMTAWEEYFPAENRWRVRYGRVVTSGAHPDGRGRAIDDSEGNQRYPQVVFDGQQHLMLWTHDATTREIRARRVNRNGTPAGNTFVVASETCSLPFDAVAMSDRTLVVYTSGSAASCSSQSSFNQSQRTLSAVEVTAQGVGRTVLVARSTTTDRPAVATDGSRAFIVWDDVVPRLSSEPCPPIYEACLFKQIVRGALLFDELMVMTIAEGAGEVSREPLVAFNGRNYLVTWLAGNDFNGSFRARARLFSRDGTPASDLMSLDVTRSGPQTAQSRADLIWDGRNFVLAWPPDSGNPFTLTLLDPNGRKLSERFLAETNASDVRSPRLVARADGAAFLLYSVLGPEESFLGHNQIVFREVLESPSRRRASTH